MHLKSESDPPLAFFGPSLKENLSILRMWKQSNASTTVHLVERARSMSESSLEEERRKKGSISAEPKTSNQKRWSPHILIKYSPKACLGADGADVANLAEYEE